MSLVALASCTLVASPLRQIRSIQTHRRLGMDIEQTRAMQQDRRWQWSVIGGGRRS